MTGAKRGAVLLLSLIGSLFLVSCLAGVTPNARYAPISGSAPAPKRTVALRVIDDREPKLGGLEKNLVGQARGGYGNPFGVRESSTDSVSKLIKAATTDALLLAGVGVHDGSDQTLIATVKKYWADGYMHYNAEIEVSFELRTAGGQVIWQAPVRVQEPGGAIGFSLSPRTKIKRMYEVTLEAFAKNAAAEFKAPAFQGGGDAPSSSSDDLLRPGVKLYSADGTLFGEVFGNTGADVVVTLAGGVRATISRAQAIDMLRAPVSLALLSPSTPRPEQATPSATPTPSPATAPAPALARAPAPPPAPTPTRAPAPSAASAPAPAPAPIPRPTPPALEVGTMLFSKDGAPFGTVKLITRSAVSVSRVNGGIVTMTREEAVSMQTKRDQVSTTPPAKAPAPTAAPARAPALARTAAEPEVAARGATPKPVPPTLAVGTKLFNPDGSLFGTVTILGRSAAAVLLANGYSTITMPRKQAVGMQR